MKCSCIFKFTFIIDTDSYMDPFNQGEVYLIVYLIFFLIKS